MIKDKTYTVYRHTAPNGKMYVGVTSQPLQKRWLNGYGYTRSTHFFNAIQKYGWDNIKHEVLLEGLSKGEASLAEKLFIGYWDLTNRDKGYNIKEGGVSNARHSQETKDKISKANKGKCHTDEAKLKMSIARRGKPGTNLGKPRSQETKAKISKALMERIISEETRQKMSDAQKRREHPRGRDNHMYGKKASKATREKLSFARKGKKLSEQHKRNISKSLMGNNNPNYEKRGKKHYASVPLICLDTGVIYYSLSDVVRLLGYLKGINVPNISDCCRGKQQTAGGYRWKYLEDINL